MVGSAVAYIIPVVLSSLNSTGMLALFFIGAKGRSLVLCRTNRKKKKKKNKEDALLDWLSRV